MEKKIDFFYSFQLSQTQCGDTLIKFSFQLIQVTDEIPKQLTNCLSVFPFIIFDLRTEEAKAGLH